MSRFLFTVWPYPGHYNPCIAMGHLLRERGHDVAFFTGAGTPVEAQGFIRFPFQRLADHLAHVTGEGELRDTPLLHERLTERYTSFSEPPLSRLRRLRAMFREMILGSVRDQAADIDEVVNRWRPDVLVTDVMMWGPILVTHEKNGLPVVPFCFFAGCLIPESDAPVPGSGLPPPNSFVGRLLNWFANLAARSMTSDLRSMADEVRREFGLPTIATTVPAYAGTMPLYLVASSPEFDFARRDLPPSVHYIGPCLWDNPRSEPAPAWIQELTTGEPLVSNEGPTVRKRFDQYPRLQTVMSSATGISIRTTRTSRMETCGVRGRRAPSAGSPGSRR